MSSLTHGLAVIAIASLATQSLAQTSFPEVEPNSVKSEATTVAGITAGNSIIGTSTGTTTTAGSTLATTVDTYRVRTAPLGLGIYKHTLTVTSATAGNLESIRSLTQTTGVPNPGTDAVFQTSNAATCVWYGFGKQEELYYQVTGTAASTAAY